MPWLARQSSQLPAPPDPACTHAAGTVWVGCPAASTAPLEMIHAPGWPDRAPAAIVKAPCVLFWNPARGVDPIVVTVRAGGNRCGRIHSGIASWRTTKMARVTAMAGGAGRGRTPGVAPPAGAGGHAARGG